MSIAIASSSAKPVTATHASAADASGASAGEETPQGPDFASLLLAGLRTIGSPRPEATLSAGTDSEAADETAPKPAADPAAYRADSVSWAFLESPLPTGSIPAAATMAPTRSDLQTTLATVESALEGRWASAQNGRENSVLAAGSAADASVPTPMEGQRSAVGVFDPAASFAVNLAGRQDGSGVLRSGDSEATMKDPPLIPVSAQLVADSAGPRPATGDLTTPLHHPSWTSDFGQKLLWFANNDHQTAHMTLHPPEMGALEITMSLHKDAASTHFVSASAEVRNALETALPRLREMFAGAGLELGQVTIGSETSRQSAHDHPPPRQPRVLPDNAILGIDPAVHRSGALSAMRAGSGLVDTFA